MGYISIGFVAFAHGGGIHQWNVPREQIPTYLKVSGRKSPGGTLLMVVVGACKRSWERASGVFCKALDFTSIHADFRTHTIRVGIHLHTCPDLVEFGLLRHIFLCHPLYLYPTAQTLGAACPGSLLQHAGSNNFGGDNQRDFGCADVLDPFVLHLHIENANETKDRHISHLRPWFIVSQFRTISYEPLP